MNETLTLEQMTGLTRLAYQYGPFLFALLFNLVLVRWGYKMYSETCERIDPPASEREKGTYRTYFLGVTSFGFLLVIASILWWWISQPQLHIYQGTIERLRDYEQIATDQLFVRTRFVKHFGDLEYQNVHFIITQPQPFSEGQRFSLLYRKGRERELELQIPYVKGDQVKFRIEWNDQTGQYQLKQITPSHTTGVYSSPSRLYASSPPQSAQNFQQQMPYRMERKMAEPDLEWIIATLQYERSEIGTKIHALETLKEAGEERYRESLTRFTAQEPFIVTLLDLTRHSDPELAFHARTLLTKHLDYMDFLFGVMSAETIAPDQAQTILLRMPVPEALALLDSLGSHQESGWAEETADGIRTGELRCRVLYPTGSSEGDRYYIEANWDIEATESVECLSRLFSGEMGRGSPEEEFEMLRHRSQRLLYGHSKHWALEMAERIESCGANSEFVSYGRLVKQSR